VEWTRENKIKCARIIRSAYQLHTARAKVRLARDKRNGISAMREKATAIAELSPSDFSVLAAACVLSRAWFIHRSRQCSSEHNPEGARKAAARTISSCVRLQGQQ
jgi:hypothetical protein